MINSSIIQKFSNIIPALTFSLHKGSCGRVGVIGGSLEYTGAPYFATISALKAGADLVHVFCSPDAALAIKSYSPELIVHPLLGVPNAIDEFTRWIQVLHALVIGPGLGRSEGAKNAIKSIIGKMQGAKINIPLIFDADGLHFFMENRTALKCYPGKIILTPNIMEYKRIASQMDYDECKGRDIAADLGVVIIKKGMHDEIIGSKENESFKCEIKGSPRRCGGQGDVLAGILGTFLAWEYLATDKKCGAAVAAYCACAMTKKCSDITFKEYGRSMTTSELIKAIHLAFDQIFIHRILA